MLVYLEQAGNLLGTTTSSPDGTFAFDYLSAAAWTVHVNVAPGHVVTTAGGDHITVPITPGATANVSFGMALAPTVTPTVTAQQWQLHLPLVIRQD